MGQDKSRLGFSSGSSVIGFRDFLAMYIEMEDSAFAKYRKMLFPNLQILSKVTILNGLLVCLVVFFVFLAWTI